MKLWELQKNKNHHMKAWVHTNRSLPPCCQPGLALFLILFIKRFIWAFPKKQVIQGEKQVISWLSYLSLKPKTLRWPYIKMNLGKNKQV